MNDYLQMTDCTITNEIIPLRVYKYKLLQMFTVGKSRNVGYRQYLTLSISQGTPYFIQDVTH